MTGMEGVGLLFLLMFIGMPLVLLAIVTGYLVHRRRSRRPGETGGAPAQEEMHPGKESIKKILMQPNLFFRQATESRPDLFYPFLMIACAGLVVCTGYLSLIFPTILYGDIPNLLVLVLGTYPLFVFSAWFGWLALSVLFFAVSAMFKGSGPFTATLRNTGYGTAFCLFLSGLVFLIGSMANAAYLAITDGINFGLYMAGQPQMPLAAVCGAGVILPLLWGVILWSFGLMHARRIPFSCALVTVMVGAAVCLALEYGPFLSPLAASLP